jgi:hypothetical protein
MNSNWQEITNTILSEHVGVLAFIVIEDALAKTRTSPTANPGTFLPEFILRVVKELPDSVNRAAIAAQLREALK